MSFQINVPPTMTAKMAKSEEIEKTTEEGEAVAAGKKREDWKKLKELEEARKAGTAPAMKDEEGKDINPHIPQYIMQAPWYFGATQPTLKHQREPTEWKKDYTKMDVWYKKGVNEESRATKYRKGACENCGAMTHKKKDCLEEERFLFPIYPLFCLLAAIFTDHLQKLYGLWLFRNKDIHYSRSSSWLALLVGIPYALACISRICAVYYGYHAPLDVFGEFHQRIQDHPELLSYSKQINVCIGKEWYRFPSNFFLPNDRWQLQFIKSEFEGLLPKPYSRSEHGTRVFPSHMNDANREEPSRYVNITSCHYLVDADFPGETALEPRYSQNSKDWHVLVSAKFLDNARSHRLFRAFFIPFVSQRYVSYINYNILVSISSNKLLQI